MPKSLNSKVKTATKWSAIAEVVAKLLTPIVSVVLARLLTPEAFGVVTTLTMIITFAEIFTDAGFQKYLIQHEFKDEHERIESVNVAFWSNLGMSLVLWGIIAVFSSSIAALVGNPGLGHVLIIACASIPLSAFSSIQMALYRRDLDFKTLFKVRLIGVFIPLIITVPLALWLRNYWALVIGTLSVNLINAVLLTWYSKWIPACKYSFRRLKEMLSFSIWSMIEQISIWLTSYIDVFIVGTMLSQYYLGLYKTSSTLVGQLMGLITAITTPILFSALSRLQDDDMAFKHMFFRFQKLVGILVIPLGCGLFLFSDLATSIMLGSNWDEASGFIGLWALTSSITIVLSHYASEVYRAKGRPKLSVLAQVLHIVVLWPTILFTVRYGFEVLYISRSIVRLELIFVNLVIMSIIMRFSVLSMIRNIAPACLSALIMMGVKFFLPVSNSIFMTAFYVLICLITYLTVLCIFKEERHLLFNIKTLIKI